MRIGLTQRVEEITDRGERRDCLDQQWAVLLAECGYCPVPLSNAHPEPGRYAKEVQLDGILLTGGNDIGGLPEVKTVAEERDRTEKVLIEYAAEHDLAVLGVCRGMQMLAHVYGTRFGLTDSHVRVEHPIEVLNACGSPLGIRDAVNSFHGYCFTEEELGNDLIAMATTTDNTVEAIKHKTLPQWGIMWHPERGTRCPEDLRLIRHIFEEERS